MASGSIFDVKNYIRNQNPTQYFTILSDGPTQYFTVENDATYLISCTDWSALVVWIVVRGPYGLRVALLYDGGGSASSVIEIQPAGDYVISLRSKVSASGWATEIAINKIS